MNVPLLMVVAGIACMAWFAGAIAAPQYQVQIVSAYPHDPKAFTQGLLFAHGELYESTGQKGHSTLRRVEVETGRILAEHALDDRYFGEGLAMVDDRLIQLTWKSGTGFVYGRKSLKKLRSFRYSGEGWGLTYDGQRLIMSDGTAVLRFLNPDSFKQTGSLTVTHLGKPISQLNELEMVNGELWANLWRYNLILRINPENGHVTGVVDASSLRKSLTGPYKIDVLNGIAYDAENKRLFLTGKWWPTLFQVKIQPRGK